MHPARRLLLSIALLASVCSASEPQAGLPLRASAASGINLTLSPREPVVIGQGGVWILDLDRPPALEAEALRVTFDAGMPAHGHGLQEATEVRPGDRPGRYEIAPVLFSMAGEWQLLVTLASATGVEQVSFELHLGQEPDRHADAALNEPLLRSLTLAALPPATDPSNRFSGVPAAAALGRELFFSRRLSGAGDLACADCHRPELAWTDGRVNATGRAALQRNTPSLLGVSHHRWYYWDGRRDSLWSQALTPIEAPAEMGGTRTDVVRLVSADPSWGPEFRELRNDPARFDDARRFPAAAGPFADPAGRRRWQAMTEADRNAINSAFADVGKVIAAFEETLQPAPTRFDRFVAQLSRKGETRSDQELLTPLEQQGLALFIDSSRTQCLQCHNGPLLTNSGFHAIGSSSGMVDLGFFLGLQAAQLDPFNCSGSFSDDRRACSSRLAGRLDASHYVGAFKVPSLRGLRQTAPYFHDGRFATLEEVLAFYRAVPQDAGRTELKPLELNQQEEAALIAFLLSLSADPTARASEAGTYLPSVSAPSVPGR